MPLIDTHPLRVAIAGAGCSGTLVAIHLLRQELPVHIEMIDERIPGRGLAYSTVWDQHLLNVPAIRMSALGGQPTQFLEWLIANGKPEANADTFAPRKMFGVYLQDLLQRAVASAPPGHRMRHHFTKALKLSHDGSSARLMLANGERLVADKVVLATGNPGTRALASSLPGYFGSPWEPGALSDLDPDREVLLAGAGLTAIDAFLALQAQSHRGKIHCFSRRGKLPQVHIVYRSLPEHSFPQGIRSARQLLRAIRARVKESARSGYDWRAVVDSLRPVTNDLWENLDAREQVRVLRHLKTWWDIHRHRMAPEIGSKVQEGLACGQLCVHAGRFRKITPARHGLEVELALRSQSALVLNVQRVINCTGSDEDYGRAANPLIRHLVETRRIRPNAIGKGLETDRHGALIGHSGTSDWLFTLGPPRLGGLFETTAVPEIRMQAEALANHLVSAEYEPVETPVEFFMAAGI